MANIAINSSISFFNCIDNSRKELIDLSDAVNNVIDKYNKKEQIAKELPFELIESDDDITSRRILVKKKIIALEEYLIRIQLKMDKLELPRIKKGEEEYPDPNARKKRKEIVQNAELLIQKIQNIKKSNEISKL